jgi:hypothetical protein
MTENRVIELKGDQKGAFKSMCKFVEDKSNRIFILMGYAGTGKTTLMRFFIDHLKEIHKDFFLLASTGRAAKVLSNLTNSSAQTIHSLIYKFTDFNKDFSEVETEPDGQLFLSFVPTQVDSIETRESIYIVDEASMISDVADELVIQAKFGSGRLLKELFDYDNRPGSKFIFIGDPCQLPPVKGTISPALSREYIEKSFQMKCIESQLTEIIRQDSGNTIIAASKKIRDLWTDSPYSDLYYSCGKVWGKLPFGNCKDIILYPNHDELVSEYTRIIRDKGYNAATCICRSNYKCFNISAQIRELLGYRSRKPQKGDLLQVIQNNLISGLMNGDMVEVTQISSSSEIVSGLSFCKVTVTELYTGRSVTQLMLEDVVYQKSLNLSSDQQKSLFWDFIMRMRAKGIKQKDKEAFDYAMRIDPYLNALRCIYGYAVTCHKSQGGEWENVFIEMPRNITLNPTKSVYQWIYTAMTRANSKLHMVNDFFIE